MRKYEIWVGYYHLGQGHHGSSKSVKVGEEMAATFQLACLQYELRSKLKFLEEYPHPERLTKQDCNWWYNPETNSNSWTGKYYETKEQADKSFNCGK